MLTSSSASMAMGCDQGHITSKFWEISDNVPKTVQDTHAVTIESYYYYYNNHFTAL